MKAKIALVFVLLSIGLLLSFKSITQHDCMVFLSLAAKEKIKVYSDALKSKEIASLGHHFASEDYLMITILDSKNNCYQVEVAYAIAGKSIRGWISHTEKLAVYAKASNKKIRFYQSFERNSKVTTAAYNPNELKVLAYHKGWLKVGEGKTVLGWLPMEEQCGNPYTTCN
ncbi:hypothetical protein VRU48_18085 [Pedobacter sp. KR3-3]|uniref:Uncharacterized protein n=1 Tax=Pedobacter albus TaxID=3113905 RepID=A0ABU7IC24_9SPHI|nr:hypothetical protein [Pedobacter sp. KR3-3]MEE1947040.1 hypothetical protein [Pedobacter sp. KR3-3]